MSKKPDPYFCPNPKTQLQPGAQVDIPNFATVFVDHWVPTSAFSSVGNLWVVTVPEQDGRKVILKCCKPGSSRFFDKELEAATNAMNIFEGPEDHQYKMYIMRIIAVCKDDASGIGPHIVCEYCPGEDIMTYLLDCPGGARRFSEDEVQHFFCQLIRGVKCMHDSNRAHRDLKPDNLMFDEKLNLKIGDFGFTKDLADDQFAVASHFSRTRCEAGAYEAGVFRAPEHDLHTAIGTVPYCPPEMSAQALTGNKKMQGLDPFKQDMFACGVCLYALVAGSFPFGMSAADRVAFQKLLDSDENLPASELHSRFWAHKQRARVDQMLSQMKEGQNIKELINLLFHASADCRPSADMVLSMPWLVGYEPVDQTEVVQSWVYGDISAPPKDSILECLANRRQPNVLLEILSKVYDN